ncbi:MAG: hypothetical protein ABIR24_01695, partial [Verrucomicrobiota bacterium]
MLGNASKFLINPAACECGFDKLLETAKQFLFRPPHRTKATVAIRMDGKINFDASGFDLKTTDSRLQLHQQILALHC